MGTRIGNNTAWPGRISGMVSAHQAAFDRFDRIDQDTIALLPAGHAGTDSATRRATSRPGDAGIGT